MVAYIVASMGGYGTRPIARLMLLCDLDLGHGYQNPTFRRWAGTYWHFVFRHFMPCSPPPTPGPCPGFLNSDHTVNDIAVTSDGASRIAYVACGKLAQLQRIDVTDAFVTGKTTTLLPRIDVDPATDWDLDRVRVDRSDPKRLFVTVKNLDLHVLDVTNPSSPGNAGTGITERFGPSLGDFHIMSMPGHAQTIWTATGGNIDHAIKVTDVVASPPVVFKELSWPNRCDGGVARPPNAIYVPTFGGVARYGPAGGGSWVADTAGYQPAEFPLGSGNTSTTEHIAIGRDLTAAGDDRLFTATGVGGFNEFRLDASFNPLPPTLTDPPAPTLISLNWSASDHYYSNDVAVAQVQGQPFVFVDLMNQSRREAALIAYAWDPMLVTWKWVAAAYWPATTGLTLGQYNTDVIDLVEPGGGTLFAFVNHTTGFASLEFSAPVSGQPASLSVVSKVDTFDPSNPAKRCYSLAHSRDRLFVTFSKATLAGGGSGGRIEVFAWNTSTGVVTTTPITYLDKNDICFTSFNSACGFSGAFRMRYFDSNPSARCGFLYVCGDGGYLYELKYDHGPTTSPSDDVLSYNDHWKSDYSGPIQDAHVYDFGSGPRILAVKDAETFALLTPSALTCP